MPGIAIPSGDLWSFNAALIEFVDGLLGLKGLWNAKDNFDGSSIDSSIWNTSTNSGGTVTLQQDEDRAYMFSNSNPNAAMLIRKVSFDPLNDEFRLDATVPIDPVTGSADIFITFNSILEPAVMSTATFSADRVITLSGGLALYVDNVDSFHSWNGAAWEAGAGGTLGYQAHRVVMRNFDDSGTMKWQLLLYDAAGTLQDTTDAVAWSATRAPAGGEALWFFTGSPRTDGSLNSNYILSYIEHGDPDGINYSTVSPVATSPWFAIDQNTLDAVTAILLQLILEGTSTIKFQWALNNGAFNGSFLTPAQLLAALVGQSITDHINSMRLMAQFNSNGDDLPRMLLPQTKVEADGITMTCDFPVEANVRLGIGYDSGNLTGSASIPGASDVRDGVPTDATTGTAAIPGADDVRLNVPTDDTVGNYVPAIEANHALGDSYGSNNTEFTGTKALTPFKLPVEVIIEDEEILVFEGAE